MSWRSVADKLPIKILALVLAVALWMLARGFANVKLETDVPVSLKNVPRGLIVQGRIPGSVHYTLSGSRISFLGFHPEKLAVDLDVAGLGAGTVTFAGMEKRLDLPAEIGIIRVYPATIEVTLASR